jgi:hypothetical protein
MDQLSDGARVATDNITDFLGFEVAGAVFDHLASEFEQKVGVFVVGNVVRFDQDADKVVFYPRLVILAALGGDGVTFARAQVGEWLTGVVFGSAVLVCVFTRAEWCQPEQ